jgi:hypothetical protein
MLASALALSAACAAGAWAAGAASASKTSPPTASTGGYGTVTLESAVVTGSTYPNNQTTSFYFQYGRSEAYEAQTPVTVAGAGTATLHVKATITKLLPDTIYYYRMVALNGSGTTYGAVRQFATKKVPLTFKLSLPYPRVQRYRRGFTVTGVLSGSGSAGHQFVLEATPFPYTHGFKPITPVRLTDANGFFSVSLPGLLENTELRIAALEPLPGHPVFSHPELVPVAPVVTLHVGPATKPGFARLYGTIEPAPALALVSFEMFAPHHKLEYVGKLVINGRPGRLDRFSRLVRIRHAGLYRVGVRTPGGAQVSGYSRLLSIG